MNFDLLDGRTLYAKVALLPTSIEKVGADKTFTIIAKNNSTTNKYIKSVTLNGKSYNKLYIDYKYITEVRTLEFEMGK